MINEILLRNTATTFRQRRFHFGRLVRVPDKYVTGERGERGETGETGEKGETGDRGNTVKGVPKVHLQHTEN